jgi:hypothetical protein
VKHLPVKHLVDELGRNGNPLQAELFRARNKLIAHSDRGDAGLRDA